MENAKALVKYANYIDGKPVPPASGEYFPTENPYTGEAWALVARSAKADVDAAVAAAQAAFESGEWSSLSASQRGRLLWRLGDLVIANAQRLADIEMHDNGKLASEVVAQRSACSAAGHARTWAPACSSSRRSSPTSTTRYGQLISDLLARLQHKAYAGDYTLDVFSDDNLHSQLPRVMARAQTSVRWIAAKVGDGCSG